MLFDKSRRLNTSKIIHSFLNYVRLTLTKSSVYGFGSLFKHSISLPRCEGLHCLPYRDSVYIIFCSTVSVQNHLCSLIRRGVFFSNIFVTVLKAYCCYHGKFSDELYSLVPRIQTITARHTMLIPQNSTTLICIQFFKGEVPLFTWELLLYGTVTSMDSSLNVTSLPSYSLLPTTSSYINITQRFNLGGSRVLYLVYFN